MSVTNLLFNSIPIVFLQLLVHKFVELTVTNTLNVKVMTNNSIKLIKLSLKFGISHVADKWSSSFYKQSKFINGDQQIFVNSFVVHFVRLVY